MAWVTWGLVPFGFLAFVVVAHAPTTVIHIEQSVLLEGSESFFLGATSFQK